MKRTPPPPRLSSSAVNDIKYTIEGTASKMLMHFAPKMDAEAIYKTMIPEEVYDTMHAASLLMPKTRYDSTFHTYTVLGEEGMGEFMCRYTMVTFTNKEQTQWLWPEHIHGIIPLSELGQKIIPVVEIAQRWKMLHHLVGKMFKDVRPAVVMHMMPWLKDIVHKILENNWVDNKNELVKLLNQPTPRDIPGISRYLHKILRDGEVLLTQHALVRDNKLHLEDNEVLLVPQMSDNLIPVVLESHYKEFINHFKPKLDPFTDR